MRKSLFLGAALCAFFCTALLPSGASASDTEDVAAGVKCIPAKKIVKLLKRFDGLDASKKDTIHVVPEMKLGAEEGGSLPERIYFRNGKKQIHFNLDKDGRVTDFARISTMHKAGDLCMQGNQFIGKAEGESGVSLSMSFDILFKNTSGLHSLAELKDGTKDGKTHYKKMFPRAFRFMVPKMTHVGVVYEVEEDAPINQDPQIFASKNGAKLNGLVLENFNGMHVIGVEDLENLGADGLLIEGPNYELTPIPSPEKMESLGFGGGEDESEDESEGADD